MPVHSVVMAAASAFIKNKIQDEVLTHAVYTFESKLFVSFEKEQH